MLPKGTLCFKCSARATILARQRQPLCHECNYQHALSKVFQALRLKIRLGQEDVVLVCLSGGHCSRMMLKLLQDCHTAQICHPERSKIYYRLLVVHIDESAIKFPDKGKSLNQKSTFFKSLAYLEEAQFIQLQLDDVLANDQGDADRSQRIDRLRCMFKEISDATLQEDLLEKLRDQLLMNVALKFGVTKIAKGCSNSYFASKIIGDVSKGKGNEISAHVHLLNAKCSGPVWIYPCRELTSKDLASLTHSCGLETLDYGPLLGTYPQTINSLAFSFINKLDLTMPSAVHAIFRTACKLEVIEG